MAEKLNVSRQSISKWETGQAYPDLDKIISLSKIFDLSIDQLCGKETNHTKNKNSLLKYIIIIIFTLTLLISSYFYYQGNANKIITILNQTEIVDANIKHFPYGYEIEIVPSFIDTNATYELQIMGYDSSELFPLSFNEDKNQLFTSFKTEMIPFNASLVISYQNDKVIVPIYSNVLITEDQYSYSIFYTKKRMQ